MKRTAPLLALAFLLLLTACQDSPPGFSYQGITTTDGVDQPLTLKYEQRADRLTGEYQVRNARGDFRGTLNNNLIRAELTPSPGCTYTFEGTLENSALTGAFSPTACPNGEHGTWTLERQ